MKTCFNFEYIIFKNIINNDLVVILKDEYIKALMASILIEDDKKGKSRYTKDNIIKRHQNVS